MVAIGSNSCHNCGLAASLLTHRCQDGKTEYVFCQKCWASELVITEQSPVQNQDEHPACQAVDESGSPCSPCLVVEGIETHPTAKKFVVITKENMEEEIEPGAHLAYTMKKLGIIYWHELFVKEIDWENEKMVVYEKTKTTGRGMHENEMNIQDLFEKQLCRKFIYDDKCLTFEESVKLAEGMVGDGKYNLVCDNCEHTARFLKTGKKESLQVENVYWYVFNLLCTNVPKFLRAPAVRSLASTVAEILVGELVQLAPYVTASLVIGAEGIAAFVVYLIIYMFKIKKLKKELKKHEISQDNFEDLRTIVRYKLSGAALGSLIGLLVASPAGIFGFKGIALAACFASVICGVIFSVILKNVAFRVVRRRNEKRSKTRKEDHLENRLMAAHRERNHAWMKMPEVQSFCNKK